jgi:dienelactone hydrolase
MEISQFEQVSTNDGVRELLYRRFITWNAQTGDSDVLLNNFRGAVSDLTNISSILADDPQSIAMQITLAVEDESGGRNTGSMLARDRRDFRTVVVEVDLASGLQSEVIHRESRESIVDYVLSPEGETLADVVYFDDSGRYILRRYGRTAQPLLEGEFTGRRPFIYGPIASGAALAVDIPGEGLVRVDLETGERTPYGEGVSRASAVIDNYAGTIVGFGGISDETGLPARRYIDGELSALQTALANALGATSVRITSWTPDRQKLIVATAEPGVPATYYLFDRADGSVGVIASEREQLSGAALPVRESLTYTARDGLEIEAYLTRPVGAEGALPLVLMPHGGPRSRDTAEFDWLAAAIADQGYAVLQPNFRGSTNAGEAFERAGFGEFGTGMITDMIDGADYLTEQGVARSSGYCAMGWSYGGYAAMMLAIEDAAEVNCAVSVAGVSDPVATLSDIRRSDGAVDFWEQYIGERPQSADARQAITPVLRAGELTAPLLLIHGLEDVVVEPGQSENMARTIGANAAYAPIEGEGHQMDSVAARLTVLNEATAFLAEHLPTDE